MNKRRCLSSSAPHFFPAGHSILLDTVRGELFCTTCKDYIYSPGFDQALQVRSIAAKFLAYSMQTGNAKNALATTVFEPHPTAFILPASLACAA